MAEIAKAAVTGPGGILLKMMFVALLSWIGGKFCEAVGKGQIAGMIHVGGVFACIVLVLQTIYDALVATGKVFGI